MGGIPLVANHHRRFASSNARQRKRRAHVAVNHENIFLAKTKDSESTTPHSSALGKLLSLRVRIDCSTRDCKKLLQHSRFLQSLASPMQALRGFFASACATRFLCDRSATHAVALARQHFLKREAVFFDALVYSE